MKNALFWLAFPLLVPQALYVRRVAPRFPAAGGPTKGSIGEGRPFQLLGIGDSIIAGVGASSLSLALIGQTAAAIATTQKRRVQWLALGASGYDSRKVLQHLVPRLPQQPADCIVVSVGVNDVTGLTSTRQWRRNLQLLLESLRRHSPEAAIAIAGLPPLHGFPLLPQPLRAVFGLRARALDEIAAEVTSCIANAVHVPMHFNPDPAKFADDGYHPSEASYAELGDYIVNKVSALFMNE